MGASKVGTGKDGSKILIEGYKGRSGRPYGYGKTSGMASADADVDSGSNFGQKMMAGGHKYNKEANGVMIKHLPSSSADADAAADAKFNGMAGYTDMEWPAVKRGGPVALSADGSAITFHDGPTVMFKDGSGDG